MLITRSAKLEKVLFLIVALLPGLVLTAAAAGAEPDLIGWWPLDEGSGTIAYDMSGNANDGAIHNPGSGLGPGDSTWDTDAERGTVVSFNGDNSSGAYIDVGVIIPPMTLTSDFTWAFWAKQLGDGTGQNEVVLGNRYGSSDSLQFSKFTPTRFEFYDNGNISGFIDYQNLSEGVWFHHAVVKDGATFTYYRNGVFSGNSTTTATLVAQPFYMGGDASGERWSGWLSDVRLYNRAVSEDEIAEIMAGYGSNKRPYVHAGGDTTVILPNDTLVLDGTVTDDGVGEPNGFLTMEWSQLSGPGVVSFEPNEFVEHPIVTFPSVLGTYILQLYATDGDKDATDTVMIAVDEPFCPVGDLDGNCRVDWLDVKFFAGLWLNDSGGVADIDGSSVVDEMDFSSLAQNWLDVRAFLVINEFVASNNSLIEDPQGQYDDWLEIFNASDGAIDVGGMYLTDNLSEPTKWRIPIDDPSVTIIPAHGYLVIWADNDIGDPGLHAGFKLDADGDEIALFDIDGVSLIDSIGYPMQSTDISYGRYPDGSNNLRFFSDATPGQKNDGAYIGRVADTKFSKDRGFYDMPFDVVISCDTPDSIIHYTTDFSTPTETHGDEYTGPIHIGTTTCLRAVAFRPGWMPSDVDTQTYIFLDEIKNQPSNPSGFPSGEDYGMDPDIVNDAVYGPQIKEALLSIPTVSITTDMGNLFGSSGIYTNQNSDWEKPTSVELIYPDSSEGFNVNCGIKIFGGASRSMSSKYSFRLKFKGMYGLTKLKYAWFGDDAADAFDTISLRGGFNDGYGWDAAGDQVQYIRDEFCRRLQTATGHAGSHGTFVHLYLNGLYWGLYNPCERPDDSFSASYYGGDKSDWDSFSHGDFEIHSGDRTALNLMLSKCRAGLGSNVAYQEIQGNNPDGTPNPDYPHLIDIPNYIDYMIVNLWSGNEDWPWNNYWLARKRTSDSTGFKFFCWDSEISMDNYRTSLTFSRTQDYRDVAEIQQYLIENTEYRMLFADHVQKYLFNNGIMTPASLIPRYQELADEVELAMIAESARWGDMHHNPPLTQQQWKNQRDDVLNTFLTQRTGIALGLFRNAGLYPNVDAPIFIVNGLYQHGGHISANDIFAMNNPNTSGTIWYTTDGNDPRPVGSTPGSINTITIVPEDASKRILVPTGSVSDAWRGGAVFDDSSWRSGSGGVGYERSSGYQSYIGIDVESDMYNSNGSCYIRIPFTLQSNPADLNSLSLQVRHDDGFVAYLNGIEVASQNAPASLSWNSVATTSNSDSQAVTLMEFDISAYRNALKVGDNILAIHALNQSASSSDFLLSVELVTAEIIGGNQDIISPTAIQYQGPLTLDVGARIKARVLSGATWSALNEAVFAVGPVKENLRITEMMYHPVDLDDPDNPNDPNEEFIELTNIGSETINLNLVKFTDGIDFTFSDIELAPGQYVLVVEDIATFEARYGQGLPIAGQFEGRLANSGEKIELVDAAGTIIHSFKYKDGWRSIADGGGYSLTIIDPYDPDPNSWGEKDSWRPSVYVGGSPGTDDSGILPNPGAVVINEILAHSHDNASDWIELYNTTDSQIDIGGWYLSDSASNLQKYKIAAGTKIDAYQYKVFSEASQFGDNSVDPGKIEAFAFSENGESAYLTSAINGLLTGYRESETFGASETGVSFGRYYKSSTGNYNFVSMSTQTIGQPNAYPKVGPIVISEISYNPSWPSGGPYTNDQYEYVELRNISAINVALYRYDKPEPWKFTEGIEYTFPGVPNEVMIPAGGYIVVAKNPEAFLWRYSEIPANKVFGPYEENLSNSGEALELSMPGDVDKFGQRQYIRVDRVVYSDGSHPNDQPGNIDLWPTEADGQGYSLHRINDSLYGNDPNNWQAEASSPIE